MSHALYKIINQVQTVEENETIGNIIRSMVFKTCGQIEVENIGRILKIYIREVQNLDFLVGLNFDLISIRNPLSREEKQDSNQGNTNLSVRKRDRYRGILFAHVGDRSKDTKSNEIAEDTEDKLVDANV